MHMLVEHCYWRYDFDLEQHELVRVTPVDDWSHREKVIAAVKYVGSNRFFRDTPWMAMLNEPPNPYYTDDAMLLSVSPRLAKDWCELVLGETTH